MGLSILPKLAGIISKRKEISQLYNRYLDFKCLRKPVIPADTIYNYGYYPVVFESELILLKVMDALAEAQVFARRYFYPSLNQLPFLSKRQVCETSESISKCVLTLPLFYDIEEKDIQRIADIVNRQL